MSIHKTDSSYVQQIEMDPAEIEPTEKKCINSDYSYGLHQVFNEDVFDQTHLDSLPLSKKENDSSFWRNLIPWWKTTQTKIETVSPIETSKEIKALPKEPINSIPMLEAPQKEISEGLNIKKSSHVTKVKSHKELLPSQIEEGLSLMSQRTIEQIKLIIYMNQFELEKDSANVAEGTYSKYQSSEKIRQKMLQEIKDALASDEKVASFFKTTQNLAIAASVVCGLAATALSFGWLAPAGATIGTYLGTMLGSSFVSVGTTLGTSGPAVSAGFTALTAAPKSYYQKRVEEDKAKQEAMSHNYQYYRDRIDDARERLMTIAETDNIFKEHLIQEFKRFHKMISLVLQ